jgi:hypothetical protein
VTSIYYVTIKNVGPNPVIHVGPHRKRVTEVTQ